MVVCRLKNRPNQTQPPRLRRGEWANISKNSVYKQNLLVNQQFEKVLF